MNSKDHPGLVQNKNERNVAKIEWQIPRKKKGKTEKEKKKAIKTYVFSPWRPLSRLKRPGQKVKSHRLGSEVISHCLEFNYYCLSICTSTAEWINVVNVCRGGNQRANLCQHPHSHLLCARVPAETLGFLSDTSLGVSQCGDGVWEEVSGEQRCWTLSSCCYQSHRPSVPQQNVQSINISFYGLWISTLDFLVAL